MSAYAIADRVLAALAADSTISPLISGRAYLITLTSGASTPAVSVSILTSTEQAGTLGTGTLTQTLLQVAVYSRERTQLRSMAEAAEAVIASINGEGSGVTVQGAPDITDRAHDFLDDANTFAVRIQAAFNH